MMSEAKLRAHVAEAEARYQALTPEQKRAHDEAQRRSFVRAEIGFGSDADELAYRAAFLAGDVAEMKRLEGEAQRRMADFDARERVRFFA